MWYLQIHCQQVDLSATRLTASWFVGELSSKREFHVLTTGIQVNTFREHCTYETKQTSALFTLYLYVFSGIKPSISFYYKM